MVSSIILGNQTANVVNAPEVVADYWKRQAEKQAGLGALLHA
jgi:hypothetical protein